MPSVQVRDNEPFEIALRRFKRGCEKAGILTETRRREFYEKPTAMRKRKTAAATKRCKRKVSMDTLRKKPPYLFKYCVILLDIVYKASFNL